MGPLKYLMNPALQGAKRVSAIWASVMVMN